MNKVINFEEFLYRQNNFYLYFIPGSYGDTCRDEEWYKKFSNENPALNQKILLEMQKLLDKKDIIGKGMGYVLDNDIQNISHSLYEAYKVVALYADMKVLFR